MINEPCITKFMDASTGHMTKSDCEKLEQWARERTAPVYELQEYGFLVYVGEIEDNWPSTEMSPAFLKVLGAAREANCDYVRFDRDGKVYPELEAFEW